MALALVTEQAWPVCTGLKRCRFSACKGSLWGWEGKRPHGFCTCVAPRACGQRRHDAEAGPVLPTHSPGRRPRCQPPRPLPGRLLRSVCPVQAVSTKKRNTLKNRRGRMTTLQLAVTNSKCWSQHIMGEITSFTISSREHRQIGSGRVFDFDVGLLIKSTKVLHACVKPSVKIFSSCFENRWRHRWRT